MNEIMHHNHLRDLIENLCLIEGDFTLSAGGAKSRFYFDCKKAALNGQALSMAAEEFLEAIDNLPSKADAIGGLTMGADFIVAAVIQRAYQKRHSVRNGAIVRKEPKKHGTMSRIENELPKGTRIVVVDDVFTTGKSTGKACDEFLNAGYEIVGIIALIDREAGAIDHLQQKYNIPVKSLFTKSDFNKLINQEVESDERVAVGA